jgi:Kef-type K+ transport system membrane component KefB
MLGAFIAGVALPDVVRKATLDQIEHAIVFMLMPFFFISVGLKVDLDYFSFGFMDTFLLATAAATLGKFFGVAIPARMVGLSWRESFALGSLMQTKGMMELAVLSSLFDAGLISRMIFSALTLMAIFTTALAMPLTRLFLSARASQDEPKATAAITL